MSDLVERKLARFQALKSDRDIIDTEFDDLARLLHPTRIGFKTELARGDGRTEDSYDSTPQQARWQLATTMEGFVTPKGGESWLKVESEDDQLMEVHDVRLWFEDVTNMVFQAIYAPEAGFHRASEGMYNDIATFGAGPISIFERFTASGLARPAFQSVHLKNCYWALNEWGEPDTFYVMWERPVAAAAALYGKENLGDASQSLLDNNKPDARIKLLHVVEPRGERNQRAEDNKNMPFASYVIDMDGKKLVEESGFSEQPYLAPIWGTVPGEPWGWSPGRLLLPDIKMLNQQARTTLEVGHFVARPPLMTPNEGVIDFSTLHPGAEVHYNVDEAMANGGRPPIIPLNIGANYPISQDMTNDTRERIWSGFLRNVLSLPVDAPRMTATEVIERKQEMLRVVGPVFGKLETDFSQKVVRRVFWILYRSGVLPPVPEAMSRGAPLKFSVNSPFSAVRKQIEAASVTRVAEIIGPLAQTQPDMLDHYDTDEIARDVGEAMMPPQWIRSREAVAEIREARRQAQDEAAQRQQTAELASVMKDVTPAVKMLEGEAA